MPFQRRVDFFKAMHVFKVKKSIAPSYISSHFKLISGVHSYGLRQSDRNFSLAYCIFPPKLFTRSAILAPSVKGLCTLLDVCNEFCIEWDICLNARKSKLMYFGKRCTDLFIPSLNGTPLEWVDSCKYLGLYLVSSQFLKCSATERIKKFYKFANAIFRIEGRSDDLTMLSLVETHCVPILTYGIEISDFF